MTVRQRLHREPAAAASYLIGCGGKGVSAVVDPVSAAPRRHYRHDDLGAANHSTPGLAVDDRGGVAVVWNARRDDPNDLCFRATVSVSVDGGASFLPNVPLMANGACPLGPGAKPPYDLDSFRGRYLNGGDTQGLAPWRGGRFLSVFIDEAAGTLQLRAATIEAAR